MSGPGPGLALADLGHDAFLTHCFLWGAGLLAQTGGYQVRLTWTDAARPRPLLRGVKAADLASLVHADASRACGQDSWVQADLPHEAHALFSPRVKPFDSERVWESVQRARHAYVDRIVEAQEWTELRYLGSLGEPAYWRHDEKGDRRPDQGATRLEMQPRNQGSEFVGTRLRKLAKAVAARDLAAVADGLTGATKRDEAGKDQPESRSGSNLWPPQPTDNVVAWCAMRGLALAPVAPQVHAATATATHLPPPRGKRTGPRDGQVVAPLWTGGGWTVARLAAVLSSGSLSVAGRAAADEQAIPGRAATWLREHGVRAVVVFPVGRFGSQSAPEQRVLLGAATTLSEGS